MTKRLLRTIVCLMLMLLMTAAVAFTANAEGDTDPSMTIKYYNLSYSHYTFVMYAVKAENVSAPEEIQMLFWTSPQDEYLVGTETYSTEYYGQETIRGDLCHIFHSGGITPKKLVETIYCRAYVQIGGEDCYSEVIKYSPVKYLKDIVVSPVAGEADINLANALRAYGAAAQIKFDWRADDPITAPHYDIELQNAVLDDGFSYGVYKEGTELTLSAVIPAGESVARWADGTGATIGTGDSITITLNSDMNVRAIFASDPDSCEHSYGAWISAADPTCTEAGCVGHYTCSICGRDFDADHNVIDGGAAIAALGHEWVNVDALAPTCIPGHTAYRYCSRCDLTEGYEELAATEGHDFVEQSVAPEGERRGYTDHVCSVCGESNGKSNYDYSLYSGVEFATEGKYAIPANFDSQTYTIEASVQLDRTVGGRAGVILGNYDAKNPAFNFEIYSGGKPRLFIMTVVNKVTTKYDYIFDTDIRSADVKNIALTIEPGEARLYVDGVLVETKQLDTFVLPSPERMMVLGGDNRSGNSQGFVGTLYSATVYRDIRTPEEIVNDLVIADANDQHCIVSYNLLSSDSLNNSVTLDNIQENAQAYNAEDLAYHASHGTRNIEIMNDITLDRTVYVLGNVTIFSNADYTILRDPDFYNDMFVVGETATGRNLILDGITCTLTISKNDAGGTLTIDGNKDNVTDTVFGTLVYINNSGNLIINEGAVLTNNEKTANSRTLGMQQYYGNMIGGAAIVNINGVVTMNGGTISDCESNYNDPSNGDNTADNHLEACYGGAVFNNSNFVMNGGTISGNSGYYGGAIANFLDTKILGGLIENNSSSHAGGAIYNYNAEGRLITVGNIEGGNDDPTAVIFRGNHNDTSGGAIYSGAECNVIIYGGATFDGNYSSGSAGALYLASYGEIGPNTVFTNNYCSSAGGAVYIISGNPAEIRSTVIDGATFTNNRANTGGAIALVGSDTTISDCTLTGNESVYSGGAIYVNRLSDGTGADVTISDSTISGNTAGNEAGAIFADLNCEVGMIDCDVTGNSSIGNGGAISLHGVEQLTLVGVDFENNSTGTTTPANPEETGVAGNGGAIYASYRTVTDSSDPENPVNTYVPSSVSATNCTFTENHSDGMGGAVMAIDHDNATTVFTATGCTFTDNDSNGSGGALVVNHTAVTVTNGTFDGNESGAHAGAVYCASSATLNTTGCSFIGNTSAANGGAIASYSNSSVRLTNVTATGNHAGSNGGVAIVNNSTLTVNKTGANRNTFGSLSDSSLGNTAGSGAGAIYCDNNAVLNISDADLGYNTAEGSGGTMYFTASTGTITNCTVDHSASGTSGRSTYGGAMLVGYGSNVTIANSAFTNNASTKWAGAIYLRRQDAVNENPVIPSTLTATNTTFSGNSAAGTDDGDGGGAIYVNTSCTLTCNGCDFTDNTGDAGGAIYAAGSTTVDLTGGSFEENESTARAGGAICIGGSGVLTTSGVTFTDNVSASTGGAIQLSTGASLTSTNDTLFDGNTSVGIGGALYLNSATANLTDTDFTGNATTGSSAWYGGAIYTNGTSALTVTRGEFTGNSNQYGTGGAICARGTGSLTVTDSTFTNNTAKLRGGAVQVFGTVTASITDSTFTGNSTTNTTASNNPGGGAIAVGNAANDGSAVTVNGGTFSSNTAYCGGAIYVMEGGSLTLAASVDDPTTGAEFSENVGGAAGGAAIYASVNSTVNADKAVFDQNSTTGSGGVVYAKEGAAVSFTDCDFTDNTAANGAAMIIYGGNVTLTNGTLSGNSSGYGAIYLRQGGSNETGTLSATGTTFSGNSSSGTGGGAVYINTNSTFTADTCAFSGNTTTGGGGAVYVTTASGQFIAEDCTFTANESKGQGGAIYSNSGYGELTGCTFYQNRSTGDGAYYAGALYLNGTSDFTIDDCTFEGNYCEKYAGGAICVRNTATLDITDSEFTGNYSKTTGGAIYIFESPTVTISGTTFTGNYSTNNMGGAIQLGKSGGTDTATLALTDCDFTGNSATSGGAIAAYATVSFTATGTDFTSNSASSTGGAVYSYLDGTTEVFTNCTFEGNTSAGNGGAVYHSAGTNMTWNNVTVKDNAATGASAKGDAVYVTNGSGKTTYFTINSATFDQNGGDPINIGNNSAYVTVTSSGVTDVNHSPVDFDLLIIGTKTHLTIN